MMINSSKDAYLECTKPKRQDIETKGNYDCILEKAKLLLRKLIIEGKKRIELRREIGIFGDSAIKKDTNWKQP